MSFTAVYEIIVSPDVVGDAVGCLHGAPREPGVTCGTDHGIDGKIKVELSAAHYEECLDAAQRTMDALKEQHPFTLLDITLSRGRA